MVCPASRGRMNGMFQSCEGVRQSFSSPIPRVPCHVNTNGSASVGVKGVGSVIDHPQGAALPSIYRVSEIRGRSSSYITRSFSLSHDDSPNVRTSAADIDSLLMILFILLILAIGYVSFVVARILLQVWVGVQHSPHQREYFRVAVCVRSLVPPCS